MATFAPVRIVISGPGDLLEVLSAEFFEMGVAGLVEEAGCLVVYPNDDQEAARYLALVANIKVQSPAGRSAGLEARVEEVDPNWHTIWQKALGPEKISRSFTLRPTHCPLGEDSKSEQTIWFEPAASFGSGGHATTRLAATWLEEYVSSQPGIECFDVGAGTGVLSLVAIRSGARSVLAVDIDEIAVENARQNCLLNAGSESIRIELGSADATSAVFDLVIANINTPILLSLSVELCARVSVSGKLLLTGLLVEDVPEIEAAFQSQQLRVSERRHADGWSLLILSRF